MNGGDLYELAKTLTSLRLRPTSCI